MKNIKRIVGVAVVIAAVAITAISTGMVQKTPEAVQNTVIGKVYGKDITVAQIQPQMQQVYSMVSQQVKGNPMDNAQAKEMIVQSREKAVNDIIDQDIIKQQVTDQKIVISDADVDKEYNAVVDNFIKQANGDKEKGTEAFNQALKSNNFADAAAYKAYLKEQMGQQKVIQNIIDATPKVTVAEAETYYNENKSKYEQPAGAQVYQIVVDSESKATELRNQYLAETKGMTNVEDKLKVFEKLASANNVDSTKNTGGSLGYIDYSSKTYVPAFVDAVKSLKQAGDVSEVINSKTDSYNVYNIVFVSQVNAEPTTQPFADVNKDDALVNQLTQQKQQQAFTAKMAEWRKTANAEVDTNKLDYPVPATETSTGSQQGGTQAPTQPQN